MIREKDIEVLVIEDNPSDVKLILHQVKKVAPNANSTVLDNYEEIVDYLDHNVPDIIMCDYNLKTFTGVEVFEFVSIQHPEIPFIFITGTIDDRELAERTVFFRAPDFVSKNDISHIHKKIEPYIEQIRNN